MSDTEHEDSLNNLNVEISDLDASYEGGRIVNACLQAQDYLTKIPWKLSRSSLLRVSILLAILVVPLFISTSYGPKRAITAQHSNQSRCITRSEVVISDGTVTTDVNAHVTIVIITQTVNSSRSSITPSNIQDGTVPWHMGKDSSSSCK